MQIVTPNEQPLTLAKVQSRIKSLSGNRAALMEKVIALDEELRTLKEHGAAFLGITLPALAASHAGERQPKRHAGESHADKIVSAMREFPASSNVMARDIARATNINRAALQMSLSALAGAGAIVRVSHGVYRLP